MTDKRIIWILSEGSPGHVSQSIGLVAALADQVPLESRQFECRPRIGGFMRSLIRLIWMGKSGRPLPSRFLNGPLGLDPIDAHEPRPDLIVASGGKSVFAARTLAVRYKIPFIFLGERKPYPPKWFHTVFTPSSLETTSTDVRMDVIPTKITPQIVQQAAADWTDRPAGHLWTMLVGGKSRSHRYTEADWANLAAGMTALAQRHGIRWLVTTSRRTGKEIEAKLRELLPPDVVAEAVWWCHAPEKKFAAYLGAAEKIWVTQDSVSMVTEAAATGLPTVLVYPQELRFPATSFMPGYLENLEALGLVQRLPIATMPEFVAQNSSTPGRSALTTADLARIARERLGWT
jgi:mitochondrial fission protein ELM1